MPTLRHLLGVQRYSKAVTRISDAVSSATGHQLTRRTLTIFRLLSTRLLAWSFAGATPTPQRITANFLEARQPGLRRSRRFEAFCRRLKSLHSARSLETDPES